MPPRPRLHPSYRPVRRGEDSVQLGLAPEAGAVLLLGLDPAEIGLLERLDGSLTETDLYALATAWGVPRRRARELLRVLGERGLLVERRGGVAVPVPPAHRYVVVAGSGPLAETVTAVLRRSGVARVGHGAWAADLAEAELRAALRPAPDHDHRPDRTGPQLVVSLAGEGGLDARGGEAWRRLGVPVLPVAGEAGRVVVGPLVGGDPEDPCLGCLELIRTDAEAGRPQAPATGPLDQVPSVVPSVPLTTVAAGAVAMLADAVLAGDPLPAGVSVEARLPWPRLDHRRWERHPACPAHTDASRAPVRTPGPG